MEYDLSNSDIRHAINTGFTGAPYANRHWQIAEDSSTSKIAAWGHRTVAIVETLPIIGAITALIERIAAYIIDVFYSITHLFSEHNKSDSKFGPWRTDLFPPLPPENPASIIKPTKVDTDAAKAHLDQVERDGGTVTVTHNQVTVTSELDFDE